VECTQRFSLFLSSLFADDQLFQVPNNFEIQSIYPNPFNASISIKFSVIAEGKVSIRLVDISGRGVCEIFNRHLFPGIHQTAWKGTDISSGIYFLILQSGDRILSSKLLHIR
ncbi:MAG: T9SS type A sorting domain-containing protein, partial [Calditrichaeota bacterium]|nr:T9SS type A sorting domain-containing protein [Calditrichota bacterium]